MRRALWPSLGLFCVLVLTLGLLAFACGGGGDEGSAPDIPHSVTATDDSYCLTCHQNGTGGAPATPHPSRSGCASCHAPSN
jgi:hypothetical protein